MRAARFLLVVPFCIAVGACGGDDAATTTSSDEAAYCEAAAELQSSQTEPTAEQLDHILTVAPDDIAADVAVLVEATRTREYPADIETHEANLIAWESEHCGDLLGGGDDEPAGD